MKKQNFVFQPDGIKRFKIAIVHPFLRWGGSEAVVFWMISALKDKYDICVVTSEGSEVNISKINKYYGTNLESGEFSVIEVPMLPGFKKTVKFAALRGRLIQRYCQKIAHDFDLMISSYNFCDFGKIGIQYAMDIEVLPEIIPLKNWKKWWYKDTILRRVYFKICELVSPINNDTWKDNINLSVSDWTAKLIYKKYGVESRILYPPVPVNFPNISYEKKEVGFVCTGRIIPEKNIDMAIRILEKVRRDGYSNIHLHIIGGTGNDRYMRTLMDLCSKHKDWIFFEGRLSDEEKNKLIANHGFGISCRKNEPFGIAVAEMVKSGCIVFVPDGGGQTEIVKDQNLIYESEDDAIRKIEMVLDNNNIKTKLREILSVQGEKFSTKIFQQEFKKMVDIFLEDKTKTYAK